MRTEQTEKRLAAELAAETPDVLSNILLCCTPEAQRRVMPIAAAKRPAGRKWVKALYAAAAMLVLFVGGYFGIGQYRQACAAEYTVTLDAGASVQLEVSRSGRVVSAAGLDEKGRAALDAAQNGGKLRGRALDTAVRTVVSAMAAQGDIADEGAVLVSVTGADADENAAAKAAVTQSVTRALSESGVTASVLAQIVEKNGALTALAEKYGISEGRAALIAETAENEPALNETELSKLSLGALAALTENGGAKASLDATAGAAAVSGYVSADAAEKSACAQAGVSIGSAASAEATADMSDGRLVYKVKIETPAGSISCEVDAKTGEITRWVSNLVSAAVGGTDAQSAGAPASQQTAGVPAQTNAAPETDVQALAGQMYDTLRDAVDRARTELENKLTQK